MRALAVVLAPFLLSATPHVQRFGEFNVTRDPTLRGVTKVFGAPDACTKRTWFSLAVWRTPGFRVRLTSLGTTPPPKFCSDPRTFIDSIVVTGKRWRTPTGLRVGDSFAKFRRLYPRAHRHVNGWGLVEIYERCVIGICPQSYWWKPQLTAVFRNSRVAGFVFPVGAQGE